MKSLTASNTAATTRLLRRILVELAVMVLAGAIGIGLVHGRSGNRTSGPATRPTTSGIYAPLDQHERHSSDFPVFSTPLQRFERQIVDLWNSVSAPLDQHERHPTGLPGATDAPLDQHERHPTGLSPMRP
jgi:hypothetical protein